MNRSLKSLKGRITIASSALLAGVVGIILAYQNCAKTPTPVGISSQASTIIAGELPNNNSPSGWMNMSGNVLLLHLDEPGGATSWSDSSGNGNTANCSGSFCPLGGSAYGYLGNGIQFDGATTYIQVPTQTSATLLNSLDNSFTLMAWANPATMPLGTDCQTTGNNCLAHIFARAGFHTGIYYGASGHFALDFWTGGSGPAQGFGVSSADPFPPGSWYHIAAVVDDSQKKAYIYVNGALSATSIYSGTLRKYSAFPVQIAGQQVSPPFFIGAALPADIEAGWGQVPPNWDNYFNGAIDEVALFTRTLSATEIQLVFNTQAAAHH